jgi:glycosyltransferase involved in cell wall biosynthesis
MPSKIKFSATEKNSDMPDIKPKAAVFSTSFGGYSQTFIWDEVRSHVQWDVEVFSKNYSNQETFPFAPVHTPANALGRLFYMNRAYWPDFDRRFKRTPFDLIHAHFGTGAVYALHYAKKFQLPLLVTFWGNDVSALVGTQRTSLKRRRYVARSADIFQSASRMLCVSTEMVEMVKELSGNDDKVFLYQHGVDIEKFFPLEQKVFRKSPDLLMIGRFTEKKGHRYALLALKHLHDGGTPATLTFIGGGELKPAIQALSERLGLSAFVHFSGVMTPLEVRDRLQQADVLLVPSIVAADHDREGSPTVVKEGGACGIPVCGFWHAGISDTVIDGKTGFLVPERHAIALADRIASILANPSLAAEMSSNAVEHIRRNHNLAKQITLLEAHYNAVSR